MPQLTKPTVVYHADWGSTDKKRWCARAVLGGDGRYTVSAAEPVRPTGSLIGRLREEAGHDGCAFAGFDFPIGVPKLYAQRAGISEFREWLPKLGSGEWKEFWSVCDEPGEISVHRPFYPNGPYMGRRQAHLLLGHAVESLDQLLRRCERGGNGQRRACSLFWTLGGNQVGKAAIIGWRNVLAPALRNSESISLWPFDGDLASLLRPGNLAIAETYPAECCRWFSDAPLGGKRKKENRRKFGTALLHWAGCHKVSLANRLTEEIQNGVPQGDDAFDAVVGLFGMLQVCLGERATGEPEEQAIRDIEGWILGRES